MIVLDYLALVLLIVCVVMIFYAFLYVHELPYEAAVHRNHPQQEAIYVACWLSLFTLHAIWPLVWIWAVSREGGAVAPALPHGEKTDHAAPRGLPLPTPQPGVPLPTPQPGAAPADLADRLARVEAQLAALQNNTQITPSREA